MKTGGVESDMDALFPVDSKFPWGVKLFPGLSNAYFPLE
jgi:hypothetical protein